VSSGKFIKAGVVGWPIGHSLSPTMHTYWLNKYGIAGSYTPLAVQPADFERFVHAAPSLGLAGVNVTIPHKEAAYRLSASLDEDARAAGAVNVLIFGEEGVEGRNTDISGFAAALRESLGADAASKGPVVVLGAGGAARAVLLALKKDGADDVRIVNRTRSRAEDLAESLKDLVSVNVFEWDDWKNAFSNAELLVNTTSLGMKGHAALQVPLDFLSPSAAVSDIVYNPLETELLREAKAQGRKTMDGLGMLMHQAVPAFAAWFGTTPEVTADLRTLLEEKLRG
jgi:shikimate dehydrogenase